MRWLRNLSIVLVVLVVVGAVAWRVVRGPDPATILASIDVPASPVLDPDAARAAFRVAPGFRVELVAAEPLVVDPVAMDWDDEGRLYVVEMRGFMGDVDGGGEERPVGRVVVLDDDDGDGRMDRSTTFLDGLVLPRAVAVLPQGVLIAEPPHLWLCADANDDGRCATYERSEIARYGDDEGNVEHRENGLLPGIDGWIYNAKSDRRFRFDGDTLEVAETAFRGQWGIAQDDLGRLYANHNSGFLYVDLFPAEYVTRQPATAGAGTQPGVNVSLADDELVWGVRVAPGLNRAYLPGTLRDDGRQKGPTAVSGLVIQRGDQYGAEYVGDAFVPESGGAAVARFQVEHAGLAATATHVLYPDADWGRREFLASTDERFRPVDAKVGPDGAVWVIDMHRGVIQHAHYVSDHLRRYVLDHALESPGATGRIWRVVREDRPIDYAPPALDSEQALVAALAHPNGWVRDRAQRRLVAASALSDAARARLADLAAWTPPARRHALEVLAQREALDAETLRVATADPDVSVRRAALAMAPTRSGVEHDDVLALAAAALDDEAPEVRLQALHTLGDVAPAIRPIDDLLGYARDGDSIFRQAALSGLAGVEQAALDRAIAQVGARSALEDADRTLVESLARAAFLAAQRAADVDGATRRLLDAIVHAGETEVASIIAAGAASARTWSGHRRVELASPHPIFESMAEGERGDALLALRRSITWPGDDRPGGARRLTADETARRARGEALFAASCATCHGVDGRGIAGLAPPLANSRWVRDADDWLVRIALQGVRGPIVVAGEAWDSVMPGHVHDARFDDDTLAGLLTHLRRSWGHGDRPVDPLTVERIRSETAGRAAPWTAEELLALEVDHRLDRFVGRFAVPLVGLELVVGRDPSGLTIGRDEGPSGSLAELGDGVFTGEGLRIQFLAAGDGTVESARVTYGGQAVPVSRVTD